MYGDQEEFNERPSPLGFPLVGLSWSPIAAASAGAPLIVYLGWRVG